MKIRVCSGFSPSGRVQYGDRFLRSFDRYWHSAVELLVYVEEPTPMPRDACRILWSIEGALHFHDRHADDPAMAGRVPKPCWKRTEVKRQYSFRTDALKFWKQILIPEAAALDGRAGPLQDGDILVWLDADVETWRDVPLTFVPELLGKSDVAFLGREPRHSEIGFWAVRMNDRTRSFLHLIAEHYRTDAFRSLPEWHSAFVWDHVRRQANLVENNMTPNGIGHVWPLTRLGRYMRHDKGWRKPK